MFSSMKREGYMESELSDIFRVKRGRQKYSPCVPGDPKLCCLCTILSLSKETYKYLEPNCKNLVFVSYVSLIFVNEKLFCLIN